MKINSLLILIFVSIFLVISALASTLIKFNSPIVTSERELAFPRLMKEINQVGKIIITSKGEAFTIVNDNEKWYLKEKNDYPVPRSKVRNFLLELTNLILVERKTKLKERLSRLHLDATSDTSDSRQINIFNKNGKLIASGFIGKRKYFLYVDGRSGTYIRKGEEFQTWLAEGEMNFGFYSKDWLDKSVFDFNPKDVKKIIIYHANGKTLETSRAEPGSQMKLKNILQNREFKTENEADRLAYVIEDFKFNDVEFRNKKNFLNKPHLESSVIYEFFDGFKIKFKIFTLLDEKKLSEFQEPTRWARINIEDVKLLPESKYTLEKINGLKSYLEKWDFKLQELDGIRTTKKMETMFKPLSN
ncbi:MAG: hypothetical protein CMM18_03725 [Rhodospirillaceae bacterium]|nr:hypothetical protein [Rhodospirillaceae bacterium]